MTLPTNILTRHWLFPNGALPLQQINLNDGLPSQQVHDFVWDQHGTLWAAGPEGLANYDGTSITVYTAQDGLATHGLRAIALDNHNQLWIGSDLGIDYMTPTGKIRSGSQNQDWPFGFVENIAIDHDNRIWLGTSQGLIYKDRDKQWTPITDKRLHHLLIRELFITAHNQVWVYTNDLGLLYFRDYIWHIPPHQHWRTLGTIFSISQGPNDTLFLGGEHGLMQITTEGFALFSTVDKIPLKNVSSITATRDLLWITHGNQLQVYLPHQSGWQPGETVIKNVSITAIKEDSDHSIWIATNSQGILHLSALHWAIAHPNQAIRNNVYTVTEPTPHTLLVGGEQSSHLIHLYPELDTIALPLLNAYKVWDITQIKPSTYMLAAQEGTFYLENQHLTKVGAHKSLFSSPGRVLLKRNDAVWVGTITGLGKYENEDTYCEIKTKNNQSLGYIYTLQEDLKGILWVGTVGNGLWYETDDGFTKYQSQEISAKGNVYAIAVERKTGQLALSQDNRLILLTPNLKTKLITTTTESVAAWSIQWSRNHPDQIWVGSKGLRLYDTQTGELLRKINTFWQNAGWEFTTSRSLAYDSSGNLFCGVSQGLLWVNTQRIRQITKPVTVRLAHADWFQADVKSVDTHYEVQPGKWVVTIQFVAIWLLDSHSIRYRFRLLGFTDQWSELDTRTSKEYTSLPPGNYTFEAQAYAPLVGFGPVKTLLSIDVQQPSWATQQISDTLHRLKQQLLPNMGVVNQLRQQNQELQIQVTAQTKQLAQLEEKLNHVARIDALTKIPNRRAFDENLTHQLRLAQRQQTPLSLILLDIDRFKLYNDTNGHLEGDRCLRRVAYTLKNVIYKENSQFVGRYGGEEFYILLANTNETEAGAVAELARLAIYNLRISYNSPALSSPLSISLGIVTVTALQHMAADTLIKEADIALYAAKEAGRNRWVSRLLS